MKLKVCGLNNSQNLKEIVKLKPDFIGFIFYSRSNRYVSGKLSLNDLKIIPDSVKKVGVFVDEDLEIVELVYKQYDLDYVQLHGKESTSYCAKLFLKQISIIKAFQMNDSFNFRTLDAYCPFCSYFLFDTKGKLNGGNGIKFNWNILNEYDLGIPFLLSGGIDLKDTDTIKALTFKRLMGVDINSRFELEPGVKDVEKVSLFKQKLELVKI